MTILRDGNDIQLQCDSTKCGETSEIYNKDDFYVMIEEAKSEGWGMRREGNEWTHTCPTCVKKGL